MPTTPNMGMILPTEGASDDVWDELLNTALNLNDEHDHTTGKGVKIPSAALKINADVSWSFSGTNYSITDVKALDFVPKAAADVSALSSALWVNSADSNALYFRNSSGVNVKITDGSTLNVSIVGGIGGDYSSVSALFDYDDATDTYRARQELSASVRQYAKLGIADLIIREYDAAGDATVPVETVTIKSPDALAASYSITLPAALPGSQALMQMSSAGVTSASNTLTQALTSNSAITTTANVTGADLRHTGVQQIVIPGALAADPNAAHLAQLGSSGAQIGWRFLAATEAITIPVPVKAGDTIDAFSVYVIKNTSNANTIAARLYRFRASTGETAVTIAASNSDNAPVAARLLTIASPIAATVTAEDEFYIIVYTTGGVAPANDYVLHATVDVKRA